jgi:hypothetical protein
LTARARRVSSDLAPRKGGQLAPQRGGSACTYGREGSVLKRGPRRSAFERFERYSFTFSPSILVTTKIGLSNFPSSWNWGALSALSRTSQCTGERDRATVSNVQQLARGVVGAGPRRLGEHPLYSARVSLTHLTRDEGSSHDGAAPVSHLVSFLPSKLEL